MTGTSKWSNNDGCVFKSTTVQCVQNQRGTTVGTSPSPAAVATSSTPGRKVKATQVKEKPAPVTSDRTMTETQATKPDLAPTVDPSTNNVCKSLLSERELDVLELVADGLTEESIGELLWISATTVRSHVRSIHRKLNVHNRPHAVAMAFKLSLLPRPSRTPVADRRAQ